MRECRQDQPCWRPKSVSCACADDHVTSQAKRTVAPSRPGRSTLAHDETRADGAVNWHQTASGIGACISGDSGATAPPGPPVGSKEPWFRRLEGQVGTTDLTKRIGTGGFIPCTRATMPMQNSRLRRSHQAAESPTAVRSAGPPKPTARRHLGREDRRANPAGCVAARAGPRAAERRDLIRHRTACVRGWPRSGCACRRSAERRTRRRSVQPPRPALRA